MVAGGGFEPQLLLGYALSWSGRWAEAKAELAALSALARTDAQRAQATGPRVLGLAWSLGRPAEAEAVLDAAASTISDDAAALELAGLRSVLDAYLGRTVQAAQTASPAHTAATRAHRLAQACEGACTPALDALAAPLPLTDREREIVTLAASGLSNRQIAQPLCVSVRTVENHLYRASTKLGTTDRAELAALLRAD